MAHNDPAGCSGLGLTLNILVFFADGAAVTALLDRLLHHAHVLKCGPRSWRMRHHILPTEGATQ